MLQRLPIVLAMGHQPELLVLDEPVAATISRADLLCRLHQRAMRNLYDCLPVHHDFQTDQFLVTFAKSVPFFCVTLSRSWEVGGATSRTVNFNTVQITGAITDEKKSRIVNQAISRYPQSNCRMSLMKSYE